jgi:hypothetical protein
MRPVEPPAVDGGEEGGANPVKSEDLLGEGLVLRQMQAERPRARVLESTEVEVGGEVNILGVVPRPGGGQVEDQVAFGLGQLGQGLPGAVDADVERGVARLPERLMDLLPVFLVRLLLPAGRLALRRLLLGVVVPDVVEHGDSQLRHRCRLPETSVPVTLIRNGRA